MRWLGDIVRAMSCRIAGIAVASVCAGVIACGGERQTVADGGPATPIAGCPDLSNYATCAVRDVPGPFVPRRANVLLVVERSARLLRVPPGAADNAWVAMTTGLAAALDRPRDNVQFAMLGYPSGMSDGCGEGCCYMLPADRAVRGPIGPDSAPRIVEVLLSGQPEGEAPMAAALATARQYLTEVDVPAQGDTFVVLIAGGGPDCGDTGTCDAERCVPNLEARCPSGGNCCADGPTWCLDDQAVSAQIHALAGVGIATIVVGLPGAGDLATVFDDFARAGGRPNPATGGAYYTGVTAADVEATMATIFGGLGGRCDATLPIQVAAPDRARVTAGCDLLSTAEVRSTPSAAATRVILEGDVCGALAQPAPPSVNVLYDCALTR